MAVAALRGVAIGARRSLKDFERALREVKRIQIKAVQVQGRTEFKYMARLYERSIYADTHGRERMIAVYGAKWAKRKQRLRLDMRRGVARKGILKTVRSPAAFKHTAGGFVIDYRLPDITITGRATVGKRRRALAGRRILEGKGKDRHVAAMQVRFQNTTSRSFRVRSYIGHFADQKAPGLGSLPDASFRRIQEHANKMTAKALAEVHGASQAIGPSVRKRVQLILRIEGIS